jgi:hypothetical protein
VKTDSRHVVVSKVLFKMVRAKGRVESKVSCEVFRGKLEAGSTTKEKE